MAPRNPFSRSKVVETAPGADLLAINRQLSTLSMENFKLTEALESVGMMLDAQGYKPLFDETARGMNIAQMRTASTQLRELTVGNPIMKRGSQYRNALIWGKGFEVDYAKMTAAAKTKMLLKVAASSNQRVLFSPDARTELERAAYTDGNFFALGDDATKTLQSRIPLQQITGAYADPDDHENVIALRRSWTRLLDDTEVLMHEWYYLDTYDGPRGNYITREGISEAVDNTKTLFWQAYNKQIGWIWGVPDALPAIAWSRLYREFLINGSVMSKALAQIAFKLTAKTQPALTAASAAIANSETSGQTAALSSTMDLVPLSSAGTSYDFASGMPMLDMVAVAIGLTGEELAGKPNSDKADGVPNSTKREMRMRQSTQGDLIRRVLVWMGANSAYTTVKFPEIDDVDAFRRQQSLASAWGTGLFDSQEIRVEMAEATEIDMIADTAPAGVMIPNNSESLKLGAEITNTQAAGKLDTKSDQKPDGSNSQSNGQGRDSQGIGKASKGDNTLRDGTTK